MSKRSQQKREKKRQKTQRKNIHTGLAPMPPDEKKTRLPVTVVKMLLGAVHFPNHKYRQDLVRVLWNDTEEELFKADFDLVVEVSNKLHREQVQAKNLQSTLSSPPVVMELHRLAVLEIAKRVDARTEDKKRLIFIKDQSGCGYWRFVVPTRYMHDEEVYIDMAETEVVYDYLLQYDTIVIQRLHSWREFYTVQRLKQAGKRVVYDIDDDIFNIPEHNYASRSIKQDQINAAKAIMKICDAITTTNETLKERLGLPDKTVVIPNAIDLDDYPQERLVSEDGLKRILWFGSPTHEKDWQECIAAVDKVMQAREDVRLTLMGYLPEVVQKYAVNGGWDAKVEYIDFRDVETYITLMKQIPGTVAIAPLSKDRFNYAKSVLKWMEYSAIWVPVVASNTLPYTEAVVHGETGFLADNPIEWERCVNALLDDDEVAKHLVNGARLRIKSEYDVKQVVDLWESVILPPIS